MIQLSKNTIIYLCLISISLLLVRPVFVYAQEKKDTISFYKKLENQSDKHKATKFIYDIILDNPDNIEDTIPEIIHKKTANPFIRYKGKIIRKISVIVLDPFGYSVNDINGRFPNKNEAIGNKLHSKTKERIIRNILLFKQDKKLVPLEISESERLLRLSPNISDARIYVTRKSGKKSDSVDVNVVVQDLWSTIVSSNFDIQTPNLMIVESNIFGIGHKIKESIAWSTSTKYLNSSGSYSVFNYKKTFISSSAFYSISKETKNYGVTIERPFYSPLTKWAGGFAISRNFNTFKQTNETSKITTAYKLDYNLNDIWMAKSFPVSTSKKTSDSKLSNNFIIGARYYHIKYFERPSYSIDTSYINSDQTMYLANIGFTNRHYYSDHFLFRFGANEDIPEGFSAELIQGTMKKENSDLKYYAGLKLAGGKYFPGIGYISCGVAYGTFYNKSLTSSGVFNFDALYFSDLVKKGNWMFRQFTRYKILQGIHRDSYEYININGSQMYGFTGNTIGESGKMILNLEFVIYAPYKFIGFRFAPVILLGYATMGNSLGALFSNTIYQSYALGILIRNEYLIVNTFEISIGLYPYMPGHNSYTLKTNPIGSYSIKAHDYLLSKPDLVSFP